MNTKLTLSLDKELIENAKYFAKSNGQSLSELVANYFKHLTNKDEEIKRKVTSPKIKNLRGIIKVDSDFNFEGVLEGELSKKYEA